MKKGKDIPNIVIPTIRSRDFMENFLKSWSNEFKGCHVIIVEDRKKKILDALFKQYSNIFGYTYTIYDWRDIDKDLGEDSWIIPRQTDCVRSYGYYKAWQNEPNMIVTLDDDVRPQENHIQTFYKKLYLQHYPPSNFYNTLTSTSTVPRGTYFRTQGCDVAHGGWLNVPDLSAEEQINTDGITDKESFNQGLVPEGSFYSMCGMNLAWKPQVTPSMYFGLQGGEYPIDRCGDIWAGYKVASDGWISHTGKPFCTHTRASNVWSNLKKEVNAKELSEKFITCFLTGEFIYRESSYWAKLQEAYEIWEGLFK